MNILFPALTFDLYLISIHFRFPSYPFVSMQIVVLSSSVPCNELAIASLQSRWSRKTRKHRKHQWNQITRRMHWCSLFPVIALPLSSLHYLSYWQEFFLHVTFSRISIEFIRHLFLQLLHRSNVYHTPPSASFMRAVVRLPSICFPISSSWFDVTWGEW